jgi:hypothetical protein
VATSKPYSIRFGAWSAISAAVSVVVPAGVVWILRDVDLVDSSITTGDFCNVEGHLNQSIFFARNQTATPGPWFEWRGRQVFNAGEHITVAPGAGAWHATLSGYQLVAP